MNQPVRSLSSGSGLDLSLYGIETNIDVVYNPSFEELYQEETAPGLKGYERAVLTSSGALAVDTGKFTGRSPKDKYRWASDTAKNDNKPLEQEVWNDLKSTVVQQLSGKRLFVVDTFCGANEDTRISVRFVMEVAWQAHFVKNMFIRPSDAELQNFVPDFVVLNGAKCVNENWQKHGMTVDRWQLVRW